MEGNDLEIKQVKLSVRVESIESLQKDNYIFKKDMAAHIKDSDALWNEASGGQTPWEQIITWALIGIKLTNRSSSSVMDRKTPNTDVEEREGGGWKDIR